MGGYGLGLLEKGIVGVIGWNRLGVGVVDYGVYGVLILLIK